VGVSVIIPAYGHCPYLPALLQALLDGTVRPDEIIVSHTGPDDPTDAVAAISDSVTVLHQAERLLGGGARNRGAAVATAEWLAFVDADVRPRRDWLQRLLDTVRDGPQRFAIGSVGCATSGGYWGMCNWMCEFNEQAPWCPAGQQTGGASCNMICRADDFQAAGRFPEEFQPGEDTVLFAQLRALGREQWFAPDATVDHHNVPGLKSFLRHQVRLGFHSALVRQRIPLRGSILVRVWPLALLAWVPRLALLARRLGPAGPGWWLRGLVFAPGLVLGGWFWTVGFVRRTTGATAA